MHICLNYPSLVFCWMNLCFVDTSIKWKLFLWASVHPSSNPKCPLFTPNVGYLHTRMDKFSSGRKLVLLVPYVAGAKGKEDGGGRKAQKWGKGKGVPAIRASVFVFCPPLIFWTTATTSTVNAWPITIRGASHRGSTLILLCLPDIVKSRHFFQVMS